MNPDLKIIKKKYGENMAKLCRELFPSLLETEGLLSQLLLSKFEPNHDLYRDIIGQERKYKFKNFIYSLVDVENNNQQKIYQSPRELLSEAGYDLYECKTEEDIQLFKKYYAEGEELCTFNGGRLNSNYVFFAVRKDVDEIKREDYFQPKRQDKYGTSVISIQFTKDSTHTLSIKNRYNHHVNNPDATFSNNLDNIINGLTESFAREYGLVQQYQNRDFELWGYVKANDGKYYKYNQEIYNVYYCPNNIIIDNFAVKRYAKEKYLVFDYFVLDLVNKELKIYDQTLEVEDSFLEIFKHILKITIHNTKFGKELNILTKDNQEIKIILDKTNVMEKFINSTIEEIGDNFLYYNEYLWEMCLPNLKKVGNSFLLHNSGMCELSLPNLQQIGNGFLRRNEVLHEIHLPKLQIVGNDFLEHNDDLIELSFPNLQRVGNNFLLHNLSLKTLNLPNLCEAGGWFLYFNSNLQEINLDNLSIVGECFLNYNKALQEISLFKLQKVGDSFLFHNEMISKLNLPNLHEVGHAFLSSNIFLEELNLPNLRRAGHDFIKSNYVLRSINMPKLQVVGDNFLLCNIDLLRLDLPALEVVGNEFLSGNHNLKEVFLASLYEIGKGFLRENELLQILHIPNVSEIDYGFLSKHPIFNRPKNEKELTLNRKLEKISPWK